MYISILLEQGPELYVLNFDHAYLVVSHSCWQLTPKLEHKMKGINKKQKQNITPNAHLLKQIQEHRS